MKTFLRWKLGLATRDVFNIVVSYTERFKDQINDTLLAGESNQSDSKAKYFFTLMTAKITKIFILLNYLAVVYPQLQILLPQSSMSSIQFTDLMTSVPSRDKNKLSAPSSFNQFGSCRRTLDRTLRLPPQD